MRNMKDKNTVLYIKIYNYYKFYSSNLESELVLIYNGIFK